jgi:hypothetical protein
MAADMIVIWKVIIELSGLMRTQMRPCGRRLCHIYRQREIHSWHSLRVVYKTCMPIMYLVGIVL